MPSNPLHNDKLKINEVLMGEKWIRSWDASDLYANIKPFLEFSRICLMLLKIVITSNPLH